MKRVPLLESRFRGIYFALVGLWLGAGFAAFILIDQWLIPDLSRQGIEQTQSLLRSHHENLLLQNHRSLRNELLAAKTIHDDRDFQQLWINKDSKEITALLEKCFLYTGAACVGPQFAIFFSENVSKGNTDNATFAIYLKNPTLTNLDRVSYLKLAIVTILTLVFGAIAYSIRRQETFFSRKVLMLAEGQARISALFSSDISPQKDELDEFSMLSRTIESAADLIRTRTEEIEKYKASFEERTRAEQFGVIAAQVSHDIRSPLASIIAIAKGAQDLDIVVRNQLQATANRIQNIANDLLAKRRELSTSSHSSKLELNSSDNQYFLSSEPRSHENVLDLISAAIKEKRLQLPEGSCISIDFTPAPGTEELFSELQAGEFHRLLSNILSNSIEAYGPEYSIQPVSVSLRKQKKVIELLIEDRGKGMRADTLLQVGTHGSTFNKENGNGLGVWHAKNTVESWGGLFQIFSNEGQGTLVSIRLSCVDPPRWWTSPSISLKAVSRLIVIDDAPDAHLFWKQRVDSSLSHNLEFVFLDSPEALLSWYRANLCVTRSLFLCNDEFSESSKSGLDIIEMLGIADSSILVTCQPDSPEIKDRCHKIGLRLFPKNRITELSISVGGLSSDETA